MKNYLTFTFGLLMFANMVFSATPTIPTGPWTELFNGKDLSNGWLAVGNPPWSVSNGILISKGGSQKNFMVWKDSLKDFELSATYKLYSTGANGGFQVRSVCCDRSKTDPTCGKTYQICGPQEDVASDYSGRLFEEEVAFLQFDGQDIDNCRRTLKVGEWMTAVSRIDGPNISMWLNGVHCLDYVFTKEEHLSGRIFGLQSHPPYDEIDYNSIKIRILNGAEVLGCTNKLASNYNLLATKDDGSCKTVSNLLAIDSKQLSIGKITDAGISYQINTNGKYILRLTDVNGIIAKEIKGNGPIQNGNLKFPGLGIYILELTTEKSTTKSKIFNF